MASIEPNIMHLDMGYGENYCDTFMIITRWGFGGGHHQHYFIVFA
jgi:hypothetical protein